MQWKEREVSSESSGKASCTLYKRKLPLEMVKSKSLSDNNNNNNNNDHNNSCLTLSIILAATLHNRNYGHALHSNISVNDSSIS